ncbi:uncharacterized protein LOC120676022 isoform X1 [Panicum virgatum]|uniref:uncharacterized protein LOC120676022 isoform X1 n=1 Tax=Panicum virgatum TaxID=38727 RepID=UPI0019D51D9E|nr:uncharacterized protein LOC120676022 isoform X1 [Panicum virgatum]XP_039813168.1 uncharacterized protein LOC120676022 isoform X1 [Panicum virgatum]
MSSTRFICVAHVLDVIIDSSNLDNTLASGMHHNCLVSAWEEEVGKGGANGKGGYQNTWLSLGQALDHLVQFWFSITDVRVGICTDPILRDGIKYTVVTRAEEIKKVHEVPCLGANGYKSALKYVYEYIRCENLQEIKTEETFYENLD